MREAPPSAHSFAKVGEVTLFLEHIIQRAKRRLQRRNYGTTIIHL